MRILVHCVYFPPEVGGLESHVYYLCRGLADRGHEVQVVTSRSRPDAPAFEELDGVRVWRTWFPFRNPIGWSAHAIGSCPKTLALARNTDVVHAQAFPSVVPGILAKCRSGVPLVATFHTSHFLVRAERPLWRPVLARLVRAPDHVLATSEEIAAVAERLAPGAGVEALTNGVETSVFRRVEPSLPQASEPRLMVPRRLFPKNGVEVFLRALPLILREIPVEAVLIGDGPERGRLEGLTAELGMAQRVRFLGRQDHADMPGLLSSGTLAVIPSLMEATSVAALEAMACELPVAASRVGGLPEIVDESVGGLFQPGDPEDLAETVVQLLRSPDLSKRGTRGRERVVERWSNDRLVHRHLEIYQELIARRERRA